MTMRQIRHQKQQLWAQGQRGFGDATCCVRCLVRNQRKSSTPFPPTLGDEALVF